MKTGIRPGMYQSRSEKAGKNFQETRGFVCSLVTESSESESHENADNQEAPRQFS